MNVVIFIIILLVLVLVHEFGHFFAAKSFDIRVDEFGFGFPPKLFSHKYGETEYSFNLLPLGGFVKIFGENMDEADFVEVGFLDKEKTPEEIELSKRSLANKPKWKQAIVLFAGVFMNFLLAWFLFSFGFMSGLPTGVGNEPTGHELRDINLVVISVLPESPAEKIGLKSGDKIVFIKKNDISTTYISPETVKSFVAGGGEIEIKYLRGKNETENLIKITPNKNENGEYAIGISMDQIGVVELPVFSAFLEGMKLALSVTKDTAVGLYSLTIDGLRGKGSLSAITGPVGMVGIVGDAYQFGLVYLLSFTALISINLAIINLLPLPALDGGRLLFLLIEKIRGKAMNPKIANTVNTVGFVILIFLMLLVTYHDVVKLF